MGEVKSLTAYEDGWAPGSENGDDKQVSKKTCVLSSDQQGSPITVAKSLKTTCLNFFFAVLNQQEGFCLISSSHRRGHMLLAYQRKGGRWVKQAALTVQSSAAFGTTRNTQIWNHLVSKQTGNSTSERICTNR